MSMKNYMVTGQELLEYDSEITTDSKGNKIISSFNYIITEIILDDKKMVIIRTEDDYVKDKKILKTMVYTKRGFEFLIETLITAEILTIEEQEEEITKMIETMVILEDYESASGLTNDWKKHKEIKKYE